MPIYVLYNGPMQTTAKPAAVTTGTAIKTMLQIKPSATIVAKILEWGYFLDGIAEATPGSVELIESDVAATVTAHATADITKLDSDALMGGDPTTNLIQVGVSASGYTATAEGTTTALRNLDAPQLGSPMAKFVREFALGREPIIQVGKFGRIRVHFASAVNMLCYMKIQI